MENSEQQTQIKNLGKLFVKELGLEPGVDTFSRWMAHYIAEKMKISENLPPGKKKDAAENECFQIILKLWEHRNMLPNGSRPLENFEIIFKVIESLNTKNDKHFFFRPSKKELLEAEASNPVYPKIKALIEYVISIDKMARVCINNLLSQAAEIANDRNTKAWLKSAVPSNADDVRAAKIVFYGIDSEDSKENPAAQRQTHIKSMIEELESFKGIAEHLLKRYKQDMKETLVKSVRRKRAIKKKSKACGLAGGEGGDFFTSRRSEPLRLSIPHARNFVLCLSII